MSKSPDDLRYTKSHEWVRTLADGNVEIGITDHAQELMGDMVYIELPESGAKLEGGKECSVVESVKAASDVYAPLAGTVVAVNDALADAPDTVNRDPYGEGWLFRLTPDDAAAIDTLLDAAAYEKVLAEDAQG
jgi:glycine cleavage system H protein